MKIQSFLPALRGGSLASVTDELRTRLEHLPAAEQLQQLIHLIEDGQLHREQTVGVVAEAWDYIKARELWRAASVQGRQTLEGLKSKLDSQFDLQEMLQTHQGITTRKDSDLAGIIFQWKASPHEILPKRMLPAWMSDHLLRRLRALSRKLTVAEAVPLLETAIAERLLKRKATRNDHLTPVDVLRVLGASKSLTKQPYPAMLVEHQRKEIPLTDSLSLSGNSVILDNVNRTPSEGTDASSSSHPSACSAPSSASSDTQPQNAAHKTAPQSEQLPGNNQQANSQTLPRSSTSRLRSFRHDRPAASNRQILPRAPITRSGKRALINSFVPSDKEGAGPGTLKSRTCRCAPPALRDLIISMVKRDDSAGLVKVKEAYELGFDGLCRSHLRSLASNAVGLKNNIDNATLKKRLGCVSGDMEQLVRIHDRNPDWFLAAHRPIYPADTLRLYRFLPIQTGPFQFDPEVVMRRFGGKDTWSDYQRDGTVIIEDAFDWLKQSDFLIKALRETDMYRYHESLSPDQPRRGWCRIMFYSKPQQLMRQDLVYYALCASARPDKNWRLVTYPYIAKNTDKDESTGFLHLDIDLDEYIETGAGANRLTTSMSLTDESPEGCTKVVPGFHHHIRDWYQRRQQRGKHTNGQTTNCSMSDYTAEDRRLFGDAIPVPCKALSVRISRAEIIHGSTARSHGRRTVLYPWHMGIEDDHETLEVPDGLTWSEVAACHRDMQPPTREPSGKKPRVTVPDAPFPADSLLLAPAPLCQALVGARKWSDVEVIHQRNILLGNDDDASLSLVRETRSQMKELFNRAFAAMEYHERRSFGEKSYFHQLSTAQGLDSNSRA